MRFTPLPLLFVLAAANWNEPQSVDLSSYLSPVRDQGSERNTCSAFAATALMEYLVRANTRDSIELSEEWAFAQGRSLALADPYLKTLYKGVDGLPGFLAVQAFENGAISQSDWAYQPNRDRHGRISSIRPKTAKALPYALEVEWVERKRIGDFLLRENRPVVMNLWWYFSAVDERGNFRMPTSEEIDACKEGQKGCQGHVVLLVGYDAPSKRFIFRNSWGSRWGNNGYGLMPERYVIEHCEACYAKPDVLASPEEKLFHKHSSLGVSGKWRAR